MSRSQRVMHGFMDNCRNDYYGEEGCCMTCDEEEKIENETHDGKCLCFECKCRQCSHYVPDSYGRNKGRCNISLEQEKEWDKVSVAISEIKAETEKASLIITEQKEETWLPKSLTKIVKRNEEYRDNSLAFWQGKTEEVLYIIIPNWLAKEKNFMGVCFE